MVQGSLFRSLPLLLLHSSALCVHFDVLEMIRIEGHQPPPSSSTMEGRKVNSNNKSFIRDCAFFPRLTLFRSFALNQMNEAMIGKVGHDGLL